MKRTIPVVITFLAGFLMIVSSFFPLTESWKEDIVIWFDILAAIAFLLGGGNLLLTHLRKISDRRAGWGYSGVTLAAFLVTLIVGLFKIGVAPAPQTERYGEVAVPFDINRFPATATLNGVLPEGELPASVLGQLAADRAAGTVTFRGWMTASQRDALKDFDLDAAWHELVVKLYDASQPPELVAKKVSYQGSLRQLNYAGAMFQDEYEILKKLSYEPDWTAAIDRLHDLSNQDHAVTLESLPAGIEIPASLKGTIGFDEETHRLQIHGPMSAAQRDELIGLFPKGPPLSAEDRETILKELQERGPLADTQEAKLLEFSGSAPSAAQRNLALMFELLKPTSKNPRPQLTIEQRNWFVEPFDRETAWRATVTELFETAHQTKYRWSGAYDSEGSLFWYIFEYGISPLQSTMFALLGFFVASAAFRAFRAKNVEATLLLSTAFIILLGATYFGTVLTSWMPESLSWLTIPELKVTIMSVFTTAGNRAIMIGIALGIASTSLKILLGVDRSYLGSDSE